MRTIKDRFPLTYDQEQELTGCLNELALWHSTNCLGFGSDHTHIDAKCSVCFKPHLFIHFLTWEKRLSHISTKSASTNISFMDVIKKKVEKWKQLKHHIVCPDKTHQYAPSKPTYENYSSLSN